MANPAATLYVILGVCILVGSVSLLIALLTVKDWWQSRQLTDLAAVIDSKSKAISAGGSAIGALGVTLGFVIAVIQISDAQQQSAKTEQDQHQSDVAKSMSEASQAMGHVDAAVRTLGAYSLVRLARQLDGETN